MPSTIRFILMDDNFNGRIKIEHTKINAFIYKIPHDMLDICKDIKELKQYGIYFLIDNKSANRKVYVGQARERRNGKGVLLRMLEAHPSIKDWTEAIIVVSAKDDYGATEISYLENKFCILAKKAGSFDVQNGNEPSTSNIKDSDRYEMDDVISYTEMMIGQLGYDIFKSTGIRKRNNRTSIKSVKEDTTQKVFYLSKRGSNAEMLRQSANSYIVSKGSVISKETTPSFYSKPCTTARHIREELIAKDVIKNFIFTQNYVFTSSSTAASVILGASANGKTSWRRKDVKTLKEIEPQ